MTTTKLTKDQQTVIDFCEAHEDIDYTIEDTGFGIVVSAQTVQEDWTDAIFYMNVLATYTSGRARQYASIVEVRVFTEAQTRDIKLKDIYRELDTAWTAHTKSGREEFQRSLAAWKAQYVVNVMDSATF